MKNLLEVSNEDLVDLIKNNIDTRTNYEKLYFQNTGFIYQVVKRYINDKSTTEDLMQQAFLGLVKAVEEYDSSRSNNFLNVLKFYLMQCLRELRSDIPEHMHRKVIKYKRILQDYEKQSLKEPSDIQIMKKMEISKEQLTYIKKLLRPAMSLDEPIGEEGDITRSSLLIDETTNIEKFIEDEELKKIINESIEMLPEAEKDVINKKYFKDKSMMEISEEMNLTYNHAKRLHDAAFKKLRGNRNLIDYSSINEYFHVGSTSFNTTWTSATEKIVLLREQLRELQTKLERR